MGFCKLECKTQCKKSVFANALVNQKLVFLAHALLGTGMCILAKHIVYRTDHLKISLLLTSTEHACVTMCVCCLCAPRASKLAIYTKSNWMAALS